jgi:hypothetical protein
MPSFIALPTELQESIIVQLNPKSTLNLARTCKALSITSLPHLYHQIHLKWNAATSAPKQPRVTSLLRSVATDPERAAAVKALKLDATGFTARKQDRLSYPKKVFRITEDDLAAAGRAISAVKMPDRKRWEDAIKDQDLDAVIALIIGQCKDLQSLSLGAYFLHSNSFFSAMVQHVVQKSGLQKLEHVSLGVDMQEYHQDVGFLKFDSQAVLPLLSLPNLRTAHVLLVNPTSEVASLPKAMALTELRLQRSRISGSHLTNLLSSTPKLTAFEYDYCPKIRQGLDCQVFMESLEPFHDTLKHLRVCVDPYSVDTLVPFEFSVDEFVSGSTGVCLKAFTALETLEISLVVLLGRFTSTAAPLSTVLPPNLQVLTIRDDLWDYEDWEWTDMEYIKLFYVFLKHGRWKEVCPNLRYINLRLRDTMDTDWGVEKREKFRQMCEVKGVGCGIYKARVDEGEDRNGVAKRKEKRGEVFGTYFETEERYNYVSSN